MVVERGHLDPVLEERLHHRVDLLAGEDEITHDHGVVAHRLECKPGTEGEAGLDLDTVEHDLQVRAREADPIDTTGLHRAFPAKGLPACFPVGLGYDRCRHGQGEQRRETCDPYAAVSETGSWAHFLAGSPRDIQALLLKRQKLALSHCPTTDPVALG